MPKSLYYPKPISFYQHADFEGERGAVVLPEADISKLTFFGADKHLIARIISQLKVVKFRRFGRLKGEFAFLSLGGVALDRDGTPIKVHGDSDDDTAHLSAFSQIELSSFSDNFSGIRDLVINGWDTYEQYDNIPVLSENHAQRNYYHYSIRFLPLMRHFPDALSTVLGVPGELTHLPFQRQLMVAGLGSRRLLSMPLIARVTNAQLLYEPFSRDGLMWLRDRVGARAKPGERRIDVTRGAPSADLKGSNKIRKGGSIIEDAAFRAFLEKNRFEIINFGNGEIAVKDQIAMIDGAQVIMSAHGANLTNIAYAEPGVSVIEILPQQWGYFSHMQIALAASLNYFGVVCDQIDQNLDMHVDLKMLSQALEAALDSRA